MHATYPLLRRTDFPPVRRKKFDTLQVNLGYLCNQTCQHCHVDAGPNRTEMMDGETVDLVLAVLQERGLQTLDLTGGAPELNVHFRRLVASARALGVQVIDRCNLTILFEPGQEDLAQFLADQGVEVTASLPCYTPENVDQQRGNGVFDKSIAGLQWLNKLGYGERLPLNLGLQPAGRDTTAESAKAGAGLQARTGATFRHYLLAALRLGQHADPTLWQHADFKGNICRIHDAA